MSSKDEVSINFNIKDKLSNYSQSITHEGEYLLSNSQIFYLNKCLPKGFKFELKEHYSKYEPIQPRKLIKKPKKRYRL